MYSRKGKVMVYPCLVRAYPSVIVGTTDIGASVPQVPHSIIIFELEV